MTAGSKPASNVSLAGVSDLSAHLVTREVRKDKPVLRVLLHSSGPAGGEPGLLCARVSAVLANKTVSGSVLHSHWSRNVEAWLSLVVSFIVILYDIRDRWLPCTERF